MRRLKIVVICLAIFGFIVLLGSAGKADYTAAVHTPYPEMARDCTIGGLLIAPAILYLTLKEM